MKIRTKYVAPFIAFLCTAHAHSAPTDGAWIGSLRCAASIQNPEKAPAFTNPVKMTVASGQVRMVRDTEVVKELYSGSVAASGQTSLAATGQYKDPSKTGTWTAKVDGQFTGVQFRGKGEIIGGNGQKVRDCLVELAKVETQTAVQPEKAATTMQPVPTGPLAIALPVTPSPTPTPPEKLSTANPTQNPLAILIDAKSFIGGNRYTQNGYWEDPKNEVFGKRTVDWTDEDFQILEDKLRAQIEVERNDAVEYTKKTGGKSSPDDNSIYRNSKKYLDDAIANIPKYKIYIGMAKEKVRAEETQRKAEALQRQDDELRHKQQQAQQAAESQQRASESSNKDNLLIFGLIVAAIGAGWFWNKFIRNRCPKCKSAEAETIGEEELDRWVGNKTVHEKHSRGTNSRSVKATYVKMRHEYRCRACQHQWTKESKKEL